MAYSSDVKIVGIQDVSTSNLQGGQYLEYNSDQIWRNTSFAGKVALANQGGQENVSAVTASGATTLNLANGNVFNVTMSASSTFTFSGATNGKACSFTVYIRHNAASLSATWPSGTRWAGGTAPTLSATSGAVDILVFESIDGGTTWFGSLVGTNFS